MNYINKQNIEEYIFDYYEGNLSDIQKAEVMSFIHQHQEYESLFAQWAMTYTLKDEEPEKYGMEHSWMQKEANNFQWKKWTTGIAIVLISFWGIYNWQINLSSKNDNQIIKPTSIKEATIIPQNKVAKTIGNKKLKINNNNTGLQNNIAEETVNQTVINTKDSIENNIVLPKTTIENEPQIATESKLSSTDSSESNTFSKEVKAEKKAKKKKIKLHLNFKQHDEFKPVNENF